MSDSLFKEGGPLGTRRIGPNDYEIHITIPPDSDGMVGRECTDPACSPGYFKVKPGTGITEGHVIAYCPYCRHEDEPGSFFTQAQKDYAIKILENETIKGVDNMIQDALGLGPSNRKKFGSGFMSIEMSYTPSRPNIVSRPLEEELRRDIICPSCGLEHAVFGLATWCPDCGTDIFLVHVEAELAVVRKILGAVDSRRSDLGARVAARDIENALEDVVSVFEAVLKVITKRYLLKNGVSVVEITRILNKVVRNSYQNVETAADTFRAQLGMELFEGISDSDIVELKSIFEKRHPITHNLGIVDRKYLDRALSGEMEGREVRVMVEDVEKALEISFSVLRRAYERI
uniref:HEPN domain-containing protein n=1 Tax=candidate division WOR-3 bacterium TaxID=2052148 RepID=A0A7V3KNJ7_UNCW3